ncbi:MAG: ankyrin repeat domain-containing protein [Candidatus Brocadiales bacterium]|nr:ankyrin repeat domain-containing protein [Candidatus Brocadiales bacterium]
MDEQLICKEIKNNNISKVSSLIQQGLDLNIAECDGQPILFAAVKSMEITKNLVENGINVNVMGVVFTPLQQAILYCNFKVAKYLIENGAEFNDSLTNPLSVIASQYFKFSKCEQELRLFLDFLAKKKFRFDSKDNKEFFMDAISRPIGLLKLFIEYGIGSVKYDGVLHKAAGQLSNKSSLSKEQILEFSKEHGRLIKFIIDSGADVNLKYSYESALHVACKASNYTAVEILIDSLADINSIDYEEWSPLDQAFSIWIDLYNKPNVEEQIKIIFLLISKGAKFNYYEEFIDIDYSDFDKLSVDKKMVALNKARRKWIEFLSLYEESPPEEVMIRKQLEKYENGDIPYSHDTDFFK